MFHHLPTRRFRKSSKYTAATATPPAPPSTPTNHLSYFPWNQSSFSVTSSVFRAELNGNREWDSREAEEGEEEEEEHWDYLDAEHVAAAVTDIDHGEIFDYAEGVQGRELTQKCVCFELPSGPRDDSDVEMDPVFYERWLERHRDLVDAEGMLRDEPEHVERGRECARKRKRTERKRSPYPDEKIRDEKKIFRRLSRVLRKRKSM
jgi:hypothetical protein